MGKRKSTAEGKGAPPTPQPQQTDGMPSAHMVAMEEARQKSKKMNDELAKKEAEYKKFTFQFRLGLLCMLAFVLFCGGVGALWAVFWVFAPQAPNPPMSPPPPSPSAPPPSPPPPVPPGRKTEPQVVVTFAAAGSLYDFDATRQNLIKDNLARAAMVPASMITLSITASPTPLLNVYPKTIQG